VITLDPRQSRVYKQVMEHSHDLAALARNVIDAAGGTMGVARKLGYSRQRVHYWRRRGVPPKALSALHRALGIHPSTVRPDLYIDAVKSADAA
jgi:DNA-binding transcriptional regulator YdaS (Cro superfamily)